MTKLEKNETTRFYSNLMEIARKPNTQQRYNLLVQLHQETLDFYVPTIRAITSKAAYTPSSDGRPLSLVVAHIMGWEEWQIQVFSDSNREERLRKQMKLQGYYDTDTEQMTDFKNVDDFNAYNARRYGNQSWNKLQQQAIDTALHLQSFFPPIPYHDWIDFLENTPMHNWRILPNNVLAVPYGWYLWMVSLEHEAVEHRKDLEQTKP
ncbi:MAG: hypothetical protein HYW24_02355 [Candidatus Aenigmarchaeota archaeon]|nr:hypothetical protein [Candidatus Aenigmarchaeota archaeon]